MKTASPANRADHFRNHTLTVAPARRRRQLGSAIAFCLLTTLALAEDNTSKAATNAPAQPIQITGIRNAFRVTDNIFSGSQPEGDEAFAALVQLGVKTIVSVDGSKPDVATAHKYVLRYVHLPFGYDGVPTNRVAELAKLTTELSGPFYVHCHHGMHRGPTAVAIICEASAGWTPERAEAWLHEAGTSDDYPGLYRAAWNFREPTAAQLAAVKELPELAKTPALVDTMVAIDGHFTRLKQSQKAGWKTPPGYADISATHEATMLWEQFRELARADDTVKRPADYREKLGAAEQSTESLRQLLREPIVSPTMDVAFKQVGQACAACHKQYRND